MIRTTVELPEALFAAAKRRAADLRRPFREIVEAGLRAQLSAPAHAKAGPPRIRWVTVKGGLPRGLDLSSRLAMYERIARAR